MQWKEALVLALKRLAQPLKNICIFVPDRVFLHGIVYCSHQKLYSYCKLASLVELYQL